MRDRLEDERNHLLRSLDDLDAEFTAGDIDEADYRTLRDDYTARAAAVIRAMEDAPEDRVATDDPAPTPRSWGRVALWTLGVLAFSVVAGMAIARASGSRGSVGTGSGDIRQTSRTMLFEAGEAAAAGDLDTAIERYSEVLEIEPANAEAFTYRGWLYWQQGDPAAAADDLAEAVAIDATYPDAQVFSAVVAVNDGRADDAAAHLLAFAELDPPAVMRQLVASARVRERTAELYAEQSRITDALEYLDALIAADPADPAPRAYRGWVVARAAVDAPELVEVAETHLLDAVEADPAFPDSHVYLAFLYNFLDRPADARDALAAYDGLVAESGDPPAHLEELIATQALRQALAP